MRNKQLAGLVGLAACLVVCVSGAHAEWKISGYTQARCNVWDDAVDDDAFDLRRVRVKLEGPVGEVGEIKLQVDLAGLDDDNGEIELKDALITRPLNGTCKAAVGFTSVPFGYEVPVSSSKRLALERSEAARRLFPGERATGAWFMFRPPQGKEGQPQVDLGLTNGMSKWYDEDSSGNADSDSFAFLGRAQWPVLKTGVAGVSYMGATRKRDLAGVSTDWGSENVLGLHARVPLARRLTLQGEYYTGAYNNTDADGWYGTLEYAIPETTATVFYRYDEFDRGATNDYTRHTAGVAWDVSSNERLTLQGEALEDYAGDKITNFALQYQVKYP